jgi:septation ring formation regulator EzrA
MSNTSLIDRSGTYSLSNQDLTKRLEFLESLVEGFINLYQQDVNCNIRWSIDNSSGKSLITIDRVSRSVPELVAKSETDKPEGVAAPIASVPEEVNEEIPPVVGA